MSSTPGENSLPVSDAKVFVQSRVADAQVAAIVNQALEYSVIGALAVTIHNSNGNS
jgi:isocitrate dehydrogenase